VPDWPTLKAQATRAEAVMSALAHAARDPLAATAV
jgi:hypothetical protein